MKSRTHLCLGWTLCLLLHPSPLEAAVCCAGSVLPDLDVPLGIPHRTVTHWWPVPTALLAAPAPIPWLAAGWLCHLAADLLTKRGIPIITPFGKKWGAGLLKTGSLWEGLIAAAALLLSLPALGGIR